jgi:hypothetical protein
MKMLWAFPREFEVELVKEMTGAEPERVFSFAREGQRMTTDAITLRILPRQHQPWIGRFVFGDPTGRWMSAVLSCPDPRELCVVSSGTGYVVKTHDPTLWSNVVSTPIVEVRQAIDAHLLLFADLTKLTGYGAGGLKWQSPRVSADGIEDIQVSARQVAVTGWDAARQHKRRVVIDLIDGSVAHDGLM